MISICCPTRGRPNNMRRVAESIVKTAHGPVELIFYIDIDDTPSIEQASMMGMGGVSQDIFLPHEGGNRQITPMLNVRHIIGERITMSDMWNVCASWAAYEVLMQCGDDIVFRTSGWDKKVLAAFESVPDRIVLVYGNDMLHGSRLPTHPFIHRNWYDAVGYLVPYGFSCDWTDNWLGSLAVAIDRYIYLPTVVTEHMHPAAGKGPMDETHRERMSRGLRDNVEALFQSRAAEREADALKLKAVIEKVRERDRYRP